MSFNRTYSSSFSVKRFPCRKLRRLKSIPWRVVRLCLCANMLCACVSECVSVRMWLLTRDCRTNLFIIHYCDVVEYGRRKFMWMTSSTSTLLLRIRRAQNVIWFVAGETTTVLSAQFVFFDRQQMYIMRARFALEFYRLSARALRTLHQTDVRSMINKRRQRHGINELLIISYTWTWRVFLHSSLTGWRNTIWNVKCTLHTSNASDSRQFWFHRID